MGAKLIICAGKKCTKRGSALLAAQLVGRLPAGVELVSGKCQKACKRGCVALLCGVKEKRWLELTPADAERLAEKVARRLAKWQAD